MQHKRVLIIQFVINISRKNVIIVSNKLSSITKICYPLFNVDSRLFFSKISSPKVIIMSGLQLHLVHNTRRSTCNHPEEVHAIDLCFRASNQTRQRKSEQQIFNILFSSYNELYYVNGVKQAQYHERCRIHRHHVVSIVISAGSLAPSCRSFRNQVAFEAKYHLPHGKCVRRG